MKVRLEHAGRDIGFGYRGLHDWPQLMRARARRVLYSRVVPDDQDYEYLRNLLAHAERWTETEAAQARSLRQAQASAAARYDQRDRRRVAAMNEVVRQFDEALATFQASP
jgi:tRNA A37 N6-isopentenylltransferase MiaA